MITEQDLQQAIAECQGERNPNAHTCIKLAAYYTIRDAMYGAHEQPMQIEPRTYSYAAAPVIEYQGDTPFAQMISGKRPDDIWPIIDELMSTLQAIHPRLYDGVMRKLQKD